MEFKPKTKHASSAQRIIRSKSVSTVPSNRKQQVQIQNILRSTGAQAKLTIGQPNDKYEQEADRVADQVMHMSDADVAQRVETGTVQPMRIQRMCPECEDEMAKRQPMEEEEEVLQTKEMLGQTPHLGSGVESRIANMKGGGQSLDQTTRAFFEPRFGADFSNVRIHSDIRAVNVAQSTNARAFTLGQDIIFGAGEYLPNELPGRKLLAHELTHVVQQRGGQRHIQRDLAIEPENLQAGVFGLLDPPQVSAALHYNLDRFANSEELRVIRDVLGLETDVYHLVDEEFVQAVASWQASHSLTNVDGKLGPDTVGSLVAEYRAEARLAPTMTPHADRLAIRTRPNERANGIDVNGHSDLFDAILSHQNAQLTLKMRIDFKFYAGSGGSALNAADQNVFIQRFTQDVYRRWSEVYALVPSGNVPNNYLDTYFAKINIEKSSSSPHYVAHIGNTTIASESTDPPGPIPSGGPAAQQDSNWLRLGDEDTGLFRGNSRADATAPSRSMRQYTAAHEFGHMMGLPHINCNLNNMICYGANQSQRANIMGLGNQVTRTNYTPFLVAMRRITGSDWQAQ